MVTKARSAPWYGGRRAAVTLGLVVILASCYANRPHQAPTIVYPSPRTGAQLNIVEADDRGNFWFAEQAESALVRVRRSAKAGPTAVVLFIHGWGHSAATDDQNLVCFSHTLDFLKERINARMAPLVAALSADVMSTRGDEPIQVVGIYVGWRGKSLPEGPSITSVLTRFPTFWTRKNTAARVGRGDLRSFTDALAQLYDSLNFPKGGTGQDRLFSLVSVGHSFGGQVLFPAAAVRLEDQLQRAAGDSAWRALRGQPILKGATGDSSYVEGLGDLVVLVNPALEAAAYERMYRLERQLKFRNTQTPVLAVFSADNDFPRHWLFPLGRTLSTAFTAPSEPGNWERDKSVLGRYSPQVTHRLEWVSDSAKRSAMRPAVNALRATNTVTESENPFTESASGCDLTKLPDVVHDELADAIRDNPAVADPTANWVINGKRLSRVSSSAGAYSPLMVVRTGSHQIIDNHNGFFTPHFVDFLIRYVTDIEEKRLQSRAARRQLHEATLR